MKTFFLIFALALFSVSAWADELTKSVQQKLKDQGFFYGEATGQPGSETDAAIRRYQIRYGLKVTGALNDETMRSLGLKPGDFPPPQNAVRHGNENSGVTPNNTPRPQASAPQAMPPRINPSPTPRPHLATPRPTPSEAARPRVQPETPPVYRPPSEEEGPSQEMPQNEPPGQGYNGRPPQNSGGGPPQNYGGRPQNGVYHGSIFAGPPYRRAPGRVQTHVLAAIQEELEQGGFYHGPVNGQPGGGTVEAISRFQETQGLPPTGRLDRRTLMVLRALPGQEYGPRIRRVYRLGPYGPSGPYGPYGPGPYGPYGPYARNYW
jgi:peptidoglycan hydrolase-like protein with peptidoglycan-binding domain